MEDIDGIYRWVGPIISDDTKRTLYTGLLIQYKIRGKSRNNNLSLFKCGFKVLVHNADKAPHIAEIEELYFDKLRRKMFVKLRWFYRHQDAKPHHKFAVSPHPREIFYSSHSDENEVAVIKGPCYVLFLLEKQLIPIINNHMHNFFVCRYQLKFPGIAAFSSNKVLQELERCFHSYPLQLQTTLRSNTNLWSVVESLGYTYKFPSFFSRSYTSTALNGSASYVNPSYSSKAHSSNSLTDSNHVDITKDPNEKASASELASSYDSDEDLYFSPKIPPTKHVLVKPFDITHTFAAHRSTPTSSSGKTSSEVDASNAIGDDDSDDSVYFAEVDATNDVEENDSDSDSDTESEEDHVISINRRSPSRKRRKLDVESDDEEEEAPLFSGKRLCTDNVEDILNSADYFTDNNNESNDNSGLINLSSSSIADERSTIKAALPPIMNSSLKRNDTVLESSPAAYLFSPPKQLSVGNPHNQLLTSPVASSMFASSADPSSANSDIDKKVERRYIKNAVDFIPDCSNHHSINRDDENIGSTSDHGLEYLVWKPTNVETNDDDNKFAYLEVFLQPMVQKVLLNALRTHQQQQTQSVGSRSERVIVDGTTVMLVGVDTHALFYELYYEQKEIQRSTLSNDFRNDTILPLVLELLEERLLPFVRIWTLSEQEILYTLCRTPARGTHIISLPIRRAQRDLDKKTTPDIIDFFEKYIGNGRYLDLVLSHGGFAYELIHSDLSLEDGLALVSNTSQNESQSGPTPPATNVSATDTTTAVAPISEQHVSHDKKYFCHELDIVGSIEEEQIRSTIYWAVEDKDLFGIDYQQQFYGNECQLVDTLVQQLSDSHDDRSIYGYGINQLTLPHMSIQEIEKERKKQKEGRINDKKEPSEETLCHLFFSRLSEVLDEYSFHQVCCALVLWQRTVITIGALVVRVSHILNGAVINHVTPYAFTGDSASVVLRESREAKKQLYQQFKELVSNVTFRRFQLPIFES